MSVTNLHKAKKEKNDEFYTKYEDIEKEVVNYKDQLKGKWVYCPCDAEWSNFWKYFVDHFHDYELRHLTATHIELDGSRSERLDYDGVMGVPINFLDKWKPDQFEVLGYTKTGSGGYDLYKPKINGQFRYVRILIRVR